MRVRSDTSAPALGLDIGGTKCAAGVVDPDGTVRSYARIATPSGTADDVWVAVVDLLEQVLRAAGIEAGGRHEYSGTELAGVGIGCGGPMLWPAGVVSPLNLKAWSAFPLRESVSRLFANLPVRLVNDAICLAIAEHWCGAARGYSNVLGVVVSTGVGDGVISHGRAVVGATGNAGHIGHIVVEPDGAPCECGGRGCLEAVARGPAIASWAVDHGWRPSNSSSGPTAESLAHDAALGHNVAIAAFNRAGHALGIAFASALATLDVELVVLGGGVSRAGALLTEPMTAAMATYAWLPFTRSIPVMAPLLGDEAGVVGAAALIHAGDVHWPI
jgi:glucokinase